MNKPVKDTPFSFSDGSMLPERLLCPVELKPASNLAAVFEDCHNYIYANEGYLMGVIFHEIVKLLVMKLYDEQAGREKGTLQFGITTGEYRGLRSDHPTPFLTRIGGLFDRVRDRYPGLFPDTILKLRPLTLAYVIGRLQHINLRDTPGDIKGEAFQAFIYRHQRGDRGEFFTPHPIVRLAVEMIAPRPEENIIDPACGSGGFLICALAYLQRLYPAQGTAAYVQNNLRGIEFNPDVALSAMIRLAFEGGTGTEVNCANALLDDESQNGSFDVVLTNPPFGSKGKVEDPKILRAYILARKWVRAQSGSWEVTKTLLKRQSPDILFLEKCIRLLRPGGRMAVVVPDGLLQNNSCSHIRHWLRSQARIVGVVSLPQEAFVPYGTGIKTSLLLLQKLPAPTTPCFMARIEKIGYNVNGQPVYKRDTGGRLVKTARGLPIIDDDIDEIAAAFTTVHTRPNPQTNEGPTISTSTDPRPPKTYCVPDTELNSRFDAEHYLPEDRELITYLHSVSAKPLGELADIMKNPDGFRLTSDRDIRYIAISDVDFRTMQVVSHQTIKAHEAPLRATYRVCTGDIITAVAGTSTGTPRQAIALITPDEDGAICSNGFAVLRNIHGIEPLFLLAYMRTDYYLRQVRRLMTGHAIPVLSTDDLARVLVPLPPRPEQERIAQSIAAIQSLRKEALKTGEQAVQETLALVRHL